MPSTNPDRIIAVVSPRSVGGTSLFDTVERIDARNVHEFHFPTAPAWRRVPPLASSLPLTNAAIGSAEELAADDQGIVFAGFTAKGKMAVRKFVKN